MPDKQPRRTISTDRFRTDDRAIEGLPVRLVIALVVGVAALGVMMTILGDVGDIGTNDVTYEADDFDDDELTVYLSPTQSGSTEHVDETITIVDDAGQPVPGGQVVLTAGENAQLSEPMSFEIDDDGQATIDTDNDDANLRMPRDYSTGTLNVEILPPSGSELEDSSSNQPINVVRGSPP